MPYKKLSSKSGYSILELSIYMLLLVVVLTLSADLLFNFTQARGKVQIDSEIQQNLRFAQEEITRSIQEANQVVNISSSSLTLSSPDSHQNPTIFRLNNNILQISKAGGAFGDLTTQKVKVTELNFAKISSASATSVQIKITIQFFGKSQSTQFTAYLRGI